jgi:hypothetical protein
LLALACGGREQAAPGTVAGSWCGREVSTPEECLGREVEYLELSQSGSQVTGQICEAYEKDCAPIEDGRFSGGKLTFSYSPVYVGGLANLELSGDVLQGTLHSDKCACETPFTFHRL